MNAEAMVDLDQMVCLDQRETAVSMVVQDRREKEDPPEVEKEVDLLGQREIRESLAPLDPRDLKVMMDAPDRMACLVLKVDVVFQERLVPRDEMDKRESQDWQVSMELLVRMVLQDVQVHLDLRESQDSQVFLAEACQDQRVVMDLQVKPEETD